MTRKIVELCMNKAAEAETKGDKAMAAYHMKQAEAAELQLTGACITCTDDCPGANCSKHGV